MKGLLIKDIKLLNNQKKQFILFLVMFVFLGFTGIFMPEFIMGYLPFTLGIFVMSTISYDDCIIVLMMILLMSLWLKYYGKMLYKKL